MPGLHHTGLTVRDLDRALDFYCGRLGMEVLFEGERQGGYFGRIVGYPDAHVRLAHVHFPGAEHRIELFQYVNPPSRGEAGEPRDVGVTHVCITVDDLAAVYGRLRDEGIEFFSPPVAVDLGENSGAAAVYMRDPDGIILELFQQA